MADQPRIDPTKVRHFQKIRVLKMDNNKICSIFPNDSLVFYVWGQNFEFLRKTDRNGLKIELITDLGDIDLVERQNGQPKQFCHQTLFSM